MMMTSVGCKNMAQGPHVVHVLSSIIKIDHSASNDNKVLE